MAQTTATLTIDTDEAKSKLEELVALSVRLNDLVGTATDRLSAAPLSEAQVKHMVDRFLMWKLPPDFRPDGGINFEKTGHGFGGQTFHREPVGTNLLTATQAKAMLLHMLEGMPQS